VRWIVWLLVVSCAGGSATSERPHTGSAGRAATPPAPSGPSDQDCDALITHAVMLGIDERAGSAAPATTAADHEAVRRALREDFLPGCRALPGDAYRCAMAATTLARMAACQPMRRSSTSNSSVAPGGMTPPAPRSP